MAHFHAGQQNALTKLLREFRINESGYFGPWEGAAVEAFQNQISKASPWKEYLTEFDVLRIIISRLYRFKSRLPENFSGLLNSLPDEKLLPDIESDIRNYFESIPRPYFVFFPLPQWPSLGIADFKLGDGISIIDTSITDDSQPEDVPKNALSGVFAGGANSLQLKFGARYLKLSAIGYCYSSIDSGPFGSAFADLKQFLFFGITTGLFHFKSHPLAARLIPFKESVPNVFVRHQDRSEDEKISIDLPLEMADYLNKLRINEERLEVWTSNGPSLLSGELVKANTDSEKLQALSRSLSTACSFIKLPQNDSDIERVRTAIQWYMDAETTQNQAISFLQRCIGLEAILGSENESKERGITDRLSDRFAYLIGKTQSERVKIKKDFVDVYGRRSDIVHSRVARLQPAHYGASIKAEFMLLKCCEKEINTLLKLKQDKADR